MSNFNHTHIIMVLDTSGSMCNLVDDTIGGLNTLVANQADEPGLCTMSLVQFNWAPEWIYQGTNVQECEPRTRKNYVPSGSTALLDTLGEVIRKESLWLNNLGEEGPGLVMLVIITDGAENSSHKFTSSSVRNLIEARQKAGWQITYLGANQDAFSEGRTIGVTAANSVDWSADTKTAGLVFENTSNLLSRTRNYASFSGLDITEALEVASYTSKERKSMILDPHETNGLN